MKKITSVSAMQAPEGVRVSYTYSEIGDNGEIVSRHNSGAFLAVQPELLAAVQTLITAAEQHLPQ